MSTTVSFDISAPAGAIGATIRPAGRRLRGGHGGGMHVSCRYPDCTGVTCVSSFDVQGGLIARETRLEVWDG